MMAASRPTRNPPLQRACKPFERSAIVAYKPSPIFRIEAKPLSAMGCLAMRGSSARGSASAGSGANLVAAYNAPIDDVPARKVRRENGFERFSIETPLRGDASVSDFPSPVNAEHSGFAAAGQRTSSIGPWNCVEVFARRTYCWSRFSEFNTENTEKTHREH